MIKNLFWLLFTDMFLRSRTAHKNFSGKDETAYPVIPSLARDLYVNIVNISIEILRLRRPAGGSAQDDNGGESRFSIITCARKNHIFCKRTQFAETFRLLGKGVNARDFYNLSQKQKPRFLLLHLALYGKRKGKG